MKYIDSEEEDRTWWLVVVKGHVVGIEESTQEIVEYSQQKEEVKEIVMREEREAKDS